MTISVRDETIPNVKIKCRWCLEMVCRLTGDQGWISSSKLVSAWLLSAEVWLYSISFSLCTSGQPILDLYDAINQLFFSAGLSQKRWNKDVKVILKRPKIVEIQINIQSFRGNWHLFGVTSGVCVCSHSAGYTQESISQSQALQIHYVCVCVCVCL